MGCRVRQRRVPLRVGHRPAAAWAADGIRRRAGAVHVRAAALHARPAQQQHGSAAVPVLLRRHLPLPRLGIRDGGAGPTPPHLGGHGLLLPRLHDEVRGGALPADRARRRPGPGSRRSRRAARRHPDLDRRHRGDARARGAVVRLRDDARGERVLAGAGRRARASTVHDVARQVAPAALVLTTSRRSSTRSVEPGRYGP